MNILQNIVKQIIKGNPQTARDIADLKRQASADFKLPASSNMDLLKAYHQLLKKKKIKKNKSLELLLRKREIRTLSGVAPIAVLTKPYPCPGQCVYCPTEKAMPKSYLSNEPAVMRAVLCDFDPYKQVKVRLDALKMEGHDTDKIELIVMGGTWSFLPRKYQLWFIGQCFKAVNGSGRKESRIKNQESGIDIKKFQKLQKQNETAKHRIIGLTLETRPDYINPEEVRWMRELGCTRVELGVQAISDSILQLCERGHKVKEIVEATKLLKNAGFKISYHLMPNLPGSTPAKDVQMFKELFTNPDFQPDMIKIYPCVVTKDAKLYNWWKQGKYKPYTDKQLLEALIKIKTHLPYYVRVTRLIRDIPNESIVAGNRISNLREYLRREMDKRGLACKCIRCREVGHIRNQELGIKNQGYKLFITKYKASGGVEYFLSYESPDRKILYAFLRLRIPSQAYSQTHSHKFASSFACSIPELANSAIVRELHTYGHLVPIASQQKGATQHFGLGKQLMAETEKIVKKLKIKRLAIISGIGVREYYKKLGYRLEGTYMVKNIK